MHIFYWTKQGFCDKIIHADSKKLYNGVWLSLVERYVRDVEAAGSNPVTPILGRGAGNLGIVGFPVLFYTQLFCFRPLP